MRANVTKKEKEKRVVKEKKVTRDWPDSGQQQSVHSRNKWSAEWSKQTSIDSTMPKSDSND